MPEVLTSLANGLGILEAREGPVAFAWHTW